LRVLFSNKRLLYLVCKFWDFSLVAVSFGDYLFKIEGDYKFFSCFFLGEDDYSAGDFPFNNLITFSSSSFS